MTGHHFVDSNVLVYRHDADEPAKQERARAVLESLWRTRAGRLSTQVLHEFYVTATRKLATPVPCAVARQEIRLLTSWKPVALTVALSEQAWRVEDRFGLSWWDSLIVAAARQANCAYLLTEDLQDGQDLDGLLVVNPFSRPSLNDLAAYGLAE
jgi:predicted nucleic acid-binding protein